MAHRKEVFKSKVLQKLYPAITTQGKEQNLSGISEDQATTTHVKRTCGEENAFGNAEKSQNASSQCRRMYTVLPPPQGYNVLAEKSVTLFQLESVNHEEDPAEERVHRSNEEEEEEDEEKEVGDQKRRRRRKKKKPGPSQDSGKDGPPESDRSGQSQVAVDKGSEHISRNKKRKLKKKRHKEKLLSLGLMPRAAALEFTYSRDEEEEEDSQRKAAEVSEFLKTTLEIYLSDSSPHGVKIPHLSATVDGLLRCLESRCNPNSVLNKLYSLKNLIQQNQADSLETALAALNDDACMSEEEANAVVSLFKYWITEILPMQRDKETRLPTAQQ
ncbi:glutamate-rich protein 1 [Poecilia formosa]|uniref:Glutamate rich 1 n=1 Tax=Poecilia formosa TaxID=48698 RepID=A0A087XK49_POEFO|nr:PREDICTED: glutamate-rich protein 1 [Poecilia formosa]